MSWIKLDDQFLAHPKVLGLSNDAKVLYLAGLSYCASQLTDGHIGTAALRLVLTLATAEFGVIAELTDAGLWERSPAGYRVHDYLDYQPSAARIKQERALSAARQAQWRERNAVSNGVTNGVTNGVPARPLPASPRTTGASKNPDTSNAATSRARPREAAAVPAELSSFDATLRGLPGYSPSAGFYAQVTKYQPALDLAEEAVKMAGWLQEHKRRHCSPAFVLGWLKRERGGDDARATAVGARGDNGRGTGPRLFGRQQTSGAEMRRQAIEFGWIDPDPELDAGPPE